MPTSQSTVTPLAAQEPEQSVTDRILSTIRNEIIEGKLPPGTALVENDLTQAHEVSRNTLREALRLLCREGLAVHYRHRGVIVRTLTRHDVRDIYRVRRTLELQALMREDPIEEDEIAAMRDAVVHAQAAADGVAHRRDFIFLNRVFAHQGLRFERAPHPIDVAHIVARQGAHDHAAMPVMHRDLHARDAALHAACCATSRPSVRSFSTSAVPGGNLP